MIPHGASTADLTSLTLRSPSQRDSALPHMQLSSLQTAWSHHPPLPPSHPHTSSFHSSKPPFSFPPLSLQLYRESTQFSLTHTTPYVHSLTSFMLSEKKPDHPTTLLSSRPISSPTHINSHKPPPNTTLLISPDKFPLPLASHT